MDSRLVKDIKKIDNIIDKLIELQPVTFINKTNNKRDVGVISQELEKDFNITLNKSQNNYLIPDYNKLIPFLITAIKELKVEINDLKAGNKPDELIQPKQTPKKNNSKKKVIKG